MHTPPIVTVFGGTGFVGRAIVDQCARLGWTVRVATRLESRAWDLRVAGPVGQVVPFEIDYNDEASLRRALNGADFAVNAVGILYERGRSTFQRIHVDLASRLAFLAKASGVKNFVHISALNCDKGASRYAKSKSLGETEVRRVFPEAVILRPSLVFGPGDMFFNRMAALMRFAPVMPLIGGGHTRFQPVYVEDVARAVTASLRDGNAQGQTFEIAGAETHSLKDLLILIRTLTKRHTVFVAVPFWYAKIKAFFLALLPNPLLTPDQVESLKTDTVAGALPGLKDLGIAPETLGDILPLYLSRHISGGPTYA